MAQHKIEHPPRRRESAGGRDVACGKERGYKIPRRSKPEKRVQPRLKPMNDVKVHLPVPPEKQQLAYKTRAERKRQFWHQYLMRLLIERVINFVIVDEIPLKPVIKKQ